MEKGVEEEILASLVGKEAVDFWSFGSSLNEFHFTYEPARLVFRILSEHWKKVKDTPTPGLVKTYLGRLKSKIGPDLWELSRTLVDTIYSSEKASTKEYISEFIVAQELEAIAEEATTLEFGQGRQYLDNLTVRLEHLKTLEGKKEFENCVRPFSKEFISGASKNLDVAYTGVPVGTGFERFDSYIDPLYPGELGVFIAPTGHGKSVWLVNLAWYCANVLDLRVVYYALDNLAAEFAERMLTVATGIPIRSARKKYSDKKVDKAISKAFYKASGGRNLRVDIQGFPRNAISVRDLKSHIRAMRPEWVKEDLKRDIPLDDAGKIDVIIMDYGDLMLPEQPSGQDWLDREKIYNSLSGLGTEELCPVWTVSQVGVDAVKKSNGVTKSYHIAGAWGKLAPVRIGIAMQQTPEEYLKGIFSAYVFKSTRSMANIVFPMKVDYAKQKITEDLNLDPHQATGGAIFERDVEDVGEELRDEAPMKADIFGGVDEEFG